MPPPIIPPLWGGAIAANIGNIEIDASAGDLSWF